MATRNATSKANTKAWRIRPPMPAEVRRSLSRYPDLVAQLLYNRSIEDDAQARDFLSSSPVSHDPFLMPGMQEAVERLSRAVDQREPTAVYGDFDVDGLSGAALLARALGELGVPVTCYIPHRVEEGHGLSQRAVEQLASQGVTLLVTVDCGISSHKEIQEAADRGIETIVTDHHLPPPEIPPAYAIVDHQLQGSGYPFPSLTGSGTALKVAQALYQSIGREMPPGLFSLAALGTIADVAPLVNENRSIVRLGLDEIRRNPSVGLRALARSAGLMDGYVDTEDVGWALAPRLNAAGRMDSAMSSYQLLMAESEEEAVTLAQRLEQWNRERQQATVEASDRARELLGDEPEPLIMVGDPSFLPGVIGLVAGRLAGELYRPAVVVATGPEVSRGSCRSIPEFDIGGALYRVAARGIPFLAHGGHRQAAGFSIVTEKLPELRERLLEVAEEQLRGQVLEPRQEIDEVIPLGTLPMDTYRLIRTLEPFGEGNPTPVFLSSGVQVASVRTMGSDGQHLRLKLKDKGVTWDAVAFNQGASGQNTKGAVPTPGDGAIDLVYTIGVDRRRPDGALRLMVLEFRRSVE